MAMTLVEYVGGATITLMLGGPDAEFSHKTVVSYSIKLPYVPGSALAYETGRVHIDDMRIVTEPLSGLDTLTESYRALLSYLSAAAEAFDYPESENRDLFPADVMAWANGNADDISSAELDIEELAGE